MFFSLLISFVSLVFGLVILLTLDANTLFLAALLLAVVSIKMQKRVDLFDKCVGVWFALSVAPATTLSINAVLTLSNGFLLQALLSWLFFVIFYTKKPSIIQKFYKSNNRAVGVIISGIIAGFAAGITSAVLWYIYIELLA